MIRSESRLYVAFLVSTLVACGGGDKSQRPTPGNNSANPFSNAGAGSGGRAGDVIPNGNHGGAGGQTSGGAGTGAGGGEVTVGDLHGCTGTSVTAPPSTQPKVDIVWVVDASGSMLDEQMRIGQNLAAFADQITAANLDVHIVMLTQSASIPVVCPEMSPDPLAGTKLDGDPRYMFLQSNVDSHNALDVVISSYPQYQSFLRPDAVTHLVTVTDDESTYKGLPTPDERAATFKTDFSALLGKDFIQHTIASPGPTACRDEMCVVDENSGICAFVMLGCGASAPGDTFYKLAELTSGLTASICLHDWTAIFTPLTAAVIASAPLPCNYPIPAPPKGESLDPDEVNVGFVQPGAAAADQEILPRAGALSECGDKIGWYYNAPAAPTEILLCPSACTHVAEGGTLNVAFGCASVVIN